MKLRVNKYRIGDVDSYVEKFASFVRGKGFEASSRSMSLTIRKGFFSKSLMRVDVGFAVIRHGDKHIVTFFKYPSLEPVLRLVLNPINGDVEIDMQCVSKDRSVCRVLEKLFKEFAMHQGYESKQSTYMYRMSDYYASRIDGLAELTLVETYLRYPFLDRYTASIEEIKNVNEFVENIARRYGTKAKEVLVHVESAHGDWKFIVVIDLDRKIYTPSFIKGSKRIVGEEVLEELGKLSNETVYITIFALRQ